MNQDIKKFLYYQAICDVVSIFGETEIGNGEVNTEAVANYVNTNNFWNDTFECKTIEDLYAFITEDILNGMPLWRFLRCSTWTQNMLERDFRAKVVQDIAEAHRKYCCYSCEFFQEHHTSLGTIYRCKAKTNSKWHEYRDNTLATLKTDCKNYKKTQTNNNMNGKETINE